MLKKTIHCQEYILRIICMFAKRFTVHIVSYKFFVIYRLDAIFQQKW